MPAFLAGRAAWAFGVHILPKKTRNLQEKSQTNWLDDRAAGYCMVLGGIRLVVREVQLDILHRNAQCSVNLCFCTSGDGIDGSRRCFLEYVDSLHTTDRIILTESEGRERQTDRIGRVLRPYRGI